MFYTAKTSRMAQDFLRIFLRFAENAWGRAKPDLHEHPLSRGCPAGWSGLQASEGVSEITIECASTIAPVGDGADRDTEGIGNVAEGQARVGVEDDDRGGADCVGDGLATPVAADGLNGESDGLGNGRSVHV